MTRRIPPDRLLESEANLRRVDGIIGEFRRDPAHAVSPDVDPAAAELRHEITTVIRSVRDCRAELDRAPDRAAITRACDLLEDIEQRVRCVAAILDPSPPEPSPAS